jgi:hypothetical protein
MTILHRNIARWSLMLWSWWAWCAMISLAAAADDEPAWEIVVDRSAKSTVSLRGAPLMTMDFVFWGGDWKFADSRFGREGFEGETAKLFGNVEPLGLAIDGRIENRSVNEIVYTFEIDAARDLRKIIGGGIQFNLARRSAAVPANAADPELLPERGGWRWAVAKDQVLEVAFSEPVAEVYFERGDKGQIRTMFVGKDYDRGRHTVVMKVSLPTGARRRPADADRYAPVDFQNWHKDTLRWDTSPIDLSYLNEKPAGRHGFVMAKGDELAFSDGTPVRFWGGNLAAYALFRPREEIAQQARRIAALGYNLMRLHHHDSTGWVSPTVIDKGKDDSRHLDAAGLDGIDYWIKCLKDQGVYVWLDLHVGRQFTPADADSPFGKIETSREIARQNHEGKGFCYYDPAVQGLMQEFQEKYLSHVNPYTGLAYKDDPGVMGLLITNENDLTHHFGNLALPDKNNPILNRLFEARLDAFCRATGLKRDLAFQTWQPGPSKIFLNDQEHRFNQAMLASLAKLGVRVPVATTNTWAGDPLYSLPALTDGGIIDVHFYESAEFLGRNPHYQSNLAHWIAAGQVHGKPLSITEWNVVENNQTPSIDRFTAPLYLAAIGSLQGWDAPMIYNYSQDPMVQPTRESTWSTYADPAIHTIMPAAAIAFRQGHIAPAQKTYCLKLDRQRLYFESWTADNSAAIRSLAEQSKLTIGLSDIAELDWDRETKPASDVIVVDDPQHDFLPPTGNAVESDTGELRRDWRQGIQTINTARTQAAQGWIGGQSIALADVTFQLQTPKAAVAVTALDNRPIQQSQMILVSAIARVTSLGPQAVYLSEPIVGTLSVRAQPGMKLLALGPDGRASQPLAASYADGRYMVPWTAQTTNHWFLLTK